MIIEFKTKNFKISLENIKNDKISIEKTVEIMTKILTVLGENPKESLQIIHDKLNEK